MRTDISTTETGPGPLLLNAKELARLLSTSAATIWRWDAAGKLPRPIRLSGGSTRWHRPTIELWLGECQRTGRLIDRAEWESIQNANGRPGK